MIFIDFNSYGGGSETWMGLNDRDSENGKIVGGDINFMSSYKQRIFLRVMVMVFNAIFNNISVIS